MKARSNEELGPWYQTESTFGGKSSKGKSVSKDGTDDGQEEEEDDDSDSSSKKIVPRWAGLNINNMNVFSLFILY